MNTTLRFAVALLMLLASGWAQAVATCTTSGSASVTVTDLFSGTNYDMQGTVTISCTRAGGDTKFPASFWVETSGTAGSRTLPGSGPAYSLSTNYSACSTAWSGTTGLSVSNAGGTTGGTTSINLSAPFCMRIATSGQNTIRPLAFNGTETLTLKAVNTGGASWGAGTLSLQATISTICKFPSSAGTLSMSYTSFQTGTATANNPFTVQCTNTTPYSLSIDATGGTLLGLTYSVGLNTVGTQTISGQSGDGTAKGYSFAGSIASGQAGICASGAGCAGADPRTITITY